MHASLMTLLMVLALLLPGCAADDPLAELDGALAKLQEALDEKRNAAVMAKLHPDFQAGDGLDAEWARRTMTGMFLVHRNVKVIVLSKTRGLAPGALDAALVEARVVLTGAERLVPDQARQYRVEMEWRRVGTEWLLFRLDWE
ncbi:MAG: hypothetical protein ACK4KV_15285 [Rhodocyclaceae bacterium]